MDKSIAYPFPASTSCQHLPIFFLPICCLFPVHSGISNVRAYCSKLHEPGAPQPVLTQGPVSAGPTGIPIQFPFPSYRSLCSGLTFGHCRTCDSSVSIAAFLECLFKMHFIFLNIPSDFSINEQDSCLILCI